jgi:hypothetical protein
MPYSRSFPLSPAGVGSDKGVVKLPEDSYGKNIDL